MRIKLLAILIFTVGLSVIGCSGSANDFLLTDVGGDQQAINSSVLLQFDFGANLRDIRPRLPDPVSSLRIEVYGPNGTLDQFVETPRVTQLELQNLNLGRTLIRIIGLDNNSNVVGFIDRG